MTVIAPIKRGKEQCLKDLLCVIGRDIEGKAGNDYLQHAQFRSLHFARWVVIPAADPENPALLAFGTDHDGPDEALLSGIAAKAMTALDTIYSHCDGWPGPQDPKQVARYFLKRRISYGARHVACRGSTVQDLKDAVAARDRMEASIDAHICPARAGEGQALDEVVAAKQLAALRDHAGPLPTIGPVPPNWQLPAGLVGVLGGGLLLFRRSPLLGVLGAAALVGAGLGFVVTLHRHEAAERSGWQETTSPTLEHLGQLRDWEDHKVQNQMTHVVPVKPGRFRRFTLRYVLAAVDLLARFHWNRGDLGGIPTIHFARWMLIENGARLLFFSNFDGSWENYLGDFVDRASAGLTGVWSNTVEFPPASNLVQEGAQQAEAFKNWTRKYQIETQAWYSAYPDVSVVNQLDALAQCRRPVRGMGRELLSRL